MCCLGQVHVPPPEHWHAHSAGGFQRALAAHYQTGAISGGVPRLGVSSWGVPLRRTMACWSLYWGTLILG